MTIWGNRSEPAPPIARWEWGIVGAFALASLTLAQANLAAPSLWHDELVHVFVARSIAETGEPRLPSGYFYTSGFLYNYILGAFVWLFGDGERAVRTPASLFAAANVALTFLAVRPVLGRRAALLAAACLALSPVSAAWARQARFYSLHQTLYLLWFIFSWSILSAPRGRPARWAGLCGVYLAAVATAFHSVIFAGLWGAYAAWMTLFDAGRRARWFGVGTAVGAVILATLAGYYFLLPAPERGAIFGMGDVLGGIGSDAIPQSENPIWEDPMYYFQWLGRNHSLAFFLLFLLGTGWTLWRREKGAVFAALAFWAPFVVLSFLIDYRRERFLLFAFPFYLALASAGTWWLIDQVRRSRETWVRGVAATIILVFLMRAAYSCVLLIGDSVETASGAHITLARRHPLWREPAAYVRENLDGGAVIATTFLSAAYYVGRCDGQYPSRLMIWEWPESDKPGIPDVTALQAFIAEHPKGFFLADWQQFGRWPQLREDIDWVSQNMRRVGAVSNEDITVYAWPKDE